MWPPVFETVAGHPIRAGSAFAAAWRASVIKPASKLDLWQLGLFMSSSSVWAATLQPPAQTGMNAQSSHSFHAVMTSKRRAAC